MTYFWIESKPFFLFLFLFLWNFPEIWWSTCILWRSIYFLKQSHYCTCSFFACRPRKMDGLIKSDFRAAQWLLEVSKPLVPFLLQLKPLAQPRPWTSTLLSVRQPWRCRFYSLEKGTIQSDLVLEKPDIQREPSQSPLETCLTGRVSLELCSCFDINLPRSFIVEELL